MIGRLVGAFAVGVVGTGAVAAWYVNRSENQVVRKYIEKKEKEMTETATPAVMADLERKRKELREKDMQVQQLNLLISGEQLVRQEEKNRLIALRNEDLKKMSKMEKQFMEELEKQKQLYTNDINTKERLLSTEKTKHNEELKEIREKRMRDVQNFSSSCAKFCMNMERTLNGAPEKETKEKKVSV